MHEATLVRCFDDIEDLAKMDLKLRTEKLEAFEFIDIKKRVNGIKYAKMPEDLNSTEKTGPKIEEIIVKTIKPDRDLNLIQNLFGALNLNFEG